MKLFLIITCALGLIGAQLPPRIAIPGAILVGQGKTIPFRQQKVIPSDIGTPPRLRIGRPVQNPAPIKPVTEEEEEEEEKGNASVINSFEDEVNKLALAGLLKNNNEPEEEIILKPSPLPFRPEKPLPLLRENIRENLPSQHLRPTQTIRHEPQIIRPSRPIPQDEPQSVRHSSRQQVRQQIVQQPQVIRQQPKPIPQRQPSQYLDDDRRTRKPPVQILRKYRTDNADGSITWGYENEDGSFKEETLGIDCITRGKYGYVDPDGLRREYSYETGNKCDPRDLEDELEQESPIRPGQQSQQQLVRKSPLRI